ncbi:unnamed protein product, partial [Amoebophrya sp. A25]|eukprot:GSA25T00007511001.1
MTSLIALVPQKVHYARLSSHASSSVVLQFASLRAKAQLLIISCAQHDDVIKIFHPDLVNYMIGLESVPDYSDTTYKEQGRPQRNKLVKRSDEFDGSNEVFDFYSPLSSAGLVGPLLSPGQYCVPF